MNSTVKNILDGVLLKLNSVYTPGVKLGELSAFVRQLATMCAAGVPLYQAINLLHEGMEESLLKRTVEKIKEKIRGGTPFSECLAEYPAIFPPLMVGLIKVGEVTGMFEKTMGKYADLLEWEEEFRSKITTMMIYPLIMLFVGGAVLVFILTVILPTFVNLFTEMKQALPLPTLILMKISSFFTGYWWVMAGLIIAGIIVYVRYAATQRGRELIDAALLKIPLFGIAVKKALLTRFSFSMGIMAGSGVPMLQALSITGDTIGNAVLSKYIKEAARNVERGDSLSASIKELNFFPKTVVQMLQVGEETGKLEDVLTRIAAFYEKEMEMTSRRIIILMEPLIILLMAVGVGFVVIAVLLPILGLSSIVK
ncbi:MAG: type II secretion system F family protein [Candidatus Firestonebacteria bacterium]